VATARVVIEKSRELAAERLEVAPADIEFSAGRFTVAGTDLAVSLEELIETSARAGPHPLDSRAGVAGTQAFPSGAHVAEVEIDPETGATELLNYVAVDDCGRVINHVLVEGQIHGGIMQGYGQVFGEHCVYDLSGQLVTGSFMDYYMPRADAGPHPQVIDHSVPSPNNLLGAKGVGEAGTTGALPTLANAVLNALRATGVRSLDLPYTPFRVWAAIAEARDAQRRQNVA
jgi:aerobic carbon-monoxide dehydrogenase large subunit